MPAFQHSPEHIAAIVGSAVHHGFVIAAFALDFASELAAHNARSVNYLYRGDEPCEPVEVTERQIIAWDAMPLEPAELNMAIRSMAYQCCEHPRWGVSYAADLLHAINARFGHTGSPSRSTWSINVPAEQWDATR